MPKMPQASKPLYSAEVDALECSTHWIKHQPWPEYWERDSERRRSRRRRTAEKGTSSLPRHPANKASFSLGLINDVSAPALPIAKNRLVTDSVRLWWPPPPPEQIWQQGTRRPTLHVGLFKLFGRSQTENLKRGEWIFQWKWLKWGKHKAGTEQHQLSFKI